ncbi:MAG TPA: Rv2993c-like domain-containing protein, partial [Candidatus Acidoferrales bacterium]|nr:Rv2993c-like domain-containing protein [Candidatus Acidoferrales bacterium]
MKLCRFEPLDSAGKQLGRTQAEAYASSHAGIMEDSVIREISGEIWGERKPTGRQWRSSEVRFLPPSWPSKIICMARNYLDHAA